MTQGEYNTIYSVDSLYVGDCEGEAEYASRTGGVCSGMSLEWLRRVVAKDEDPEYTVPDVVYSRMLQEYVENHDVWLDNFPGAVGLRNSGRWDFSDLNQGLTFVYNHPGAYLLAYMPEDERGGHAYGFISRKNFPDYLMDPAYACYRIYSQDALGNRFRKHPYVSGYEGDGMKLMVIRVEHDSKDDVDDSENDNDIDNDNDSEVSYPDGNNSCGSAVSCGDCDTESESELDTVVVVDACDAEEEYCDEIVVANSNSRDTSAPWCHLKIRTSTSTLTLALTTETNE